MAKYSKSHEREEREKMGRGFWHSLFGLLFCWVPGLGLLLSISGFVRQIVRITEKHRVRLALYLVAAIISLVLCVTVLVAEVFQYSRNPDLPHDVLEDVWQTLTGQSELPWEAASGGTDYSGYDQPGLGVLDGYEGDPDDPGEDGSVPDEQYTDDGLIGEDDNPDDGLSGEDTGEPDSYTEPEGDSPDDGLSDEDTGLPGSYTEPEGDSPDGV